MAASFVSIARSCSSVTLRTPAGGDVGSFPTRACAGRSIQLRRRALAARALQSDLISKPAHGHNVTVRYSRSDPPTMCLGCGLGRPTGVIWIRRGFRDGTRCRAGAEPMQPRPDQCDGLDNTAAGGVSRSAAPFRRSAGCLTTAQRSSCQVGNAVSMTECANYATSRRVLYQNPMWPPLLR
jgi:hypothetical protein